MKIGILGTGVVGRTIGVRLVELGHTVTIGTRSVDDKLAENVPNFFGNPPFRVWYAQHPQIGLRIFAEAAAQSELIINATSGSASIEALKLAGETNLNGKVLIDISNPLDFSKGMPPTLLVCNTDSVSEQIQQTFPLVKVVKSLNTVTASVMVNPLQLADGEHHMFVCGNDAGAKALVCDILQNWFGWKYVLDLGDISAARGLEMYLPLWLRLMGTLGTPMLNVRLVN
jgi:predicted dinucleotide-binding enzyme